MPNPDDVPASVAAAAICLVLALVLILGAILWQAVYG